MGGTVYEYKTFYVLELVCDNMSWDERKSHKLGCPPACRPTIGRYEKLPKWP